MYSIALHIQNIQTNPDSTSKPFGKNRDEQYASNNFINDTACGLLQEIFSQINITELAENRHEASAQMTGHYRLGKTLENCAL